VLWAQKYIAMSNGKESWEEFKMVQTAASPKTYFCSGLSPTEFFYAEQWIGSHWEGE